MTCAEVREALSAYLAGALAEAEIAALDAHVPACPECAAEFDRMLLQDRALSEMAGKSGIDVFLSNHPNVDSAIAKLDAVKARRPGQPNPFVVGPSTVQRFLTVVGECAKAQMATF